MAFKKDGNGQMFIVSDEVDVDDIDFDQMIEPQKSNIQKIAETIQNTLITANKNASQENVPQKQEILKKQEPIWFQILFVDNENKEYVYSGILVSANKAKSGLNKFNIKMDRVQALDLFSFTQKQGFEDLMEIKAINYVYEEKDFKKDYLLKTGKRNFSLNKIKILDDLSNHFVNVKIDLFLVD
jgi:hypothetical protein